MWNRWGRVGEKGQNLLIPCGSSKPKAISGFEKKFMVSILSSFSSSSYFSLLAFIFFIPCC